MEVLRRLRLCRAFETPPRHKGEREALQTFESAVVMDLLVVGKHGGPYLTVLICFMSPLDLVYGWT